MQGQIQQQSQQAAAQNALQQVQAETQSKLQVKQAESAFDIQKMQSEADLKMKLMELEFNYQMQLKGVEVNTLTEKEKMKEEAKDKRVSLQNTQQSKLIDQRKNNLPPVDFESTNDSLDSFDFSQFGPR